MVLLILKKSQQQGHAYWEGQVQRPSVYPESESDVVHSDEQGHCIGMQYLDIYPGNKTGRVDSYKRYFPSKRIQMWNMGF